MEIEKAYELPSGQLRSKHGLAGFDADGILCWTLVKSELSVWAAEQEKPIVTSASLPCAMHHALISTLAVKVSKVFMTCGFHSSNHSHKSMQESTSTACIVCTAEGNVFAWPKLSQNIEQEPLQARISQEVTSLSDILIVGHHPSTSAISAILGAADGRLYRLDCIDPSTSTEAMSITPLQPEVIFHLLLYNLSHMHCTTCDSACSHNLTPEIIVCRKV